MVDFVEKLSGAPWLSDLSPIVEYDGFQKIRYLQSADLGRILIINDELQHVEAWAPFYHEIIVHLPCSFIPSPKKALVMGGGSLFAVEELLKYETIEAIDLVDHDSKVTFATLEAYPERAFILDDPRLNIIEQKCENFVQSCRVEYDVIINDCLDLFAFDREYDADIYQLLENLLSSDGIVSDLIYRSIYVEGYVERALRRVRNGLSAAGAMLAIPEYPGSLHVLSMWGRNEHLKQTQNVLYNAVQTSMHEQGLFKIYNPKHLSYYLYLPPYLKKYIR